MKKSNQYQVNVLAAMLGLLGKTQLRQCGKPKPSRLRLIQKLSRYAVK